MIIKEREEKKIKRRKICSLGLWQLWNKPGEKWTTSVVLYQLSLVIHEENVPLLANKEGVVTMMFNEHSL